MPTHWSERLAVYETSEETVAQFRQRCNISDEAPSFTPYSGFILRPGRERRLVQSSTTLWESLTYWEKVVERHFTPEIFHYREDWHAPSSVDFGNTLFDESDFDPENEEVDDDWILVPRPTVYLFYPTEFTWGLHRRKSYAYEFRKDRRLVTTRFQLYNIGDHADKGEPHFYPRDSAHAFKTLESYWLTTQEEYYRARLLTPSTTNGYYFFY